MEDKAQRKINREKLKSHPKKSSNFILNLFFCWQIPIVIKGWKKELTEDDLYEPLEECKSKKLGEKLEELWQAEENFQKNPSLLKVLMKMFGPQILVYGVIYCPFQLARIILQPLCLKKLLDYYTPGQSEITTENAYFYASMIIVVNFMNSLVFHFATLQLEIVAIKMQVACSSLIYRRALKLKRSDLEKVTIGKIVNLLSNDISRFDSCFDFINLIWTVPLVLGAGVWYINEVLGPTSVSGIAVIFSLIAAQMLAAKKLLAARRKVATATDSRVRLMNDVVCGINAIKLYTWEKPFTELVEATRKSELQNVKIANSMRLLNCTFRNYFTKLTLLLPLVLNVVTVSSITPQYIFTFLNIYEMFRVHVGLFFYAFGNVIPEIKVSIQRLQEHLLHDDQEPSIVKKRKPHFSSNCVLMSKLNFVEKNVGVSLKNVNVKWNEACPNMVLKNIDFQASSGDLVGVIGPAGSGKSTLLHTILKEACLVTGNVDVEGAISYASQEPWIFSASVKQNILFGQEFDLQKYIKVIEICALEHDLSLFSHGDQTIVGERGVMLSGGQKARINLARAVYRDADIYLLDDPLTAVDSEVAQQIFNECISKYLKTKCVVLVTHQVQYLESVDKIYCLEKGNIVSKDTLLNFGKYVTSNKSDETRSFERLALQNHSLQFEVKEHRSSGSTDFKVYTSYCRSAGSYFFFCLICFLFLISQICNNFSDNFLTFWANLEQDAVKVDNKFSTIFTTYGCLYIYTASIVLLILLIHLASYCFITFCLEASKNLHKNMLNKIMHGTMTFFNNQSSGRILNRFTKDMGCIDESIPFCLLLFSYTVFNSAGVLFNLIYSNYWLMPVAVLHIILVLCFTIFFQNANTNLKRTESTTRSAVFTHLSASVQGLTTIKAFGVQNTVIEEFDNYQDVNTSAAYLFKAISAAYGFWIDMNCLILTSFVIFSFFLINHEISVGYVGLAITQSIALMGIIQHGLKSWSELNSYMVLVERVVDYIELDPEQDNGTVTPPEGWPTAGNVSFSSVSLKYAASSPLVLKKISFNINAGEKIGIIGRTGAGKTSLTSVLFRLYNFDGFVFIDGIDTKSVPLNTLRSKISIIPQDPILFYGTLRKNIDPFNEYSDSQIWTCLEETELKDMVSNLPSGLESIVSEKGANFSVGQRQLLCLIRTMLRNNKIVVLDEATANVDLKTDELIQSTIRNKFKDCTVMTIAHRLKTVIDSDKILVMDDGEVVEFGDPKELLRSFESLFYKYVKSNGMLTQFKEVKS